MYHPCQRIHPSDVPTDAHPPVLPFPEAPMPSHPPLSRRRLLRQAVAGGLATPLLAAAPVPSAASRRQQPLPPVAERRPSIQAQVNGLSVDPYRWLEDPTDPDVIAYLDAENAYLEASMAPLTDLQQTLYDELLQRIDIDDQSVPVPWHGYLYYTRSEKGLDYGLVCRRRDEPGAPEQILIDLNQIESDSVSMSGWEPTIDNRFLAFSLDLTGDEIHEISILDMDSAVVVERIPRGWGFVWGPDSRTLFYAAQVDARRTSEIRRHKLGTDPAADATILKEEEPSFSVGVGATKDRRFVVTYASAFDTNELHYIPADDLDGSPRLLAPRMPGVTSGLEHQNGRFLLLTDRDAPNNTLLTAPAGDAPPESWETLVDHDTERPLSGLDVFADHLVIYGRAGGFTTVWTFDEGTATLDPIAFDEAIYLVQAGANWTYDTDRLRVVYTSPITPDTDYEIDLRTRAKTILKRQPVPADYDPSRYVTERLYAPSGDGVEVPISLVTLRDGGDRPRPLRMDGYGGYGVNQEPVFSLARLILIDRGVTIATTHIRGGAELGRWWWDDGRLLEKTNGFTDFIACGDYLVREGYTSPDLLAAMGGSNGGLLMGAVANERPDLFKAIVANVPLADVIAFLLRSPIGAANMDELGDPRDPAFYTYQLSYSPYQNVTDRAYPAMLVTAGIEDSRTPYWLAAKWVAQLRHVGTGDEPLFLRTTMAGGHGGSSGIDNFAKDTAQLYAFLLSQFGLAEPTTGASPAPPSARREDSRDQA
jgi:oligopeptidase B